MINISRFAKSPNSGSSSEKANPQCRTDFSVFPARPVGWEKLRQRLIRGVRERERVADYGIGAF